MEFGTGGCFDVKVKAAFSVKYKLKKILFITSKAIEIYSN